jgi:hypothetical protein
MEDVACHLSDSSHCARIIPLILVVLALDCARADDSPVRADSTVLPGIVTNSVSSTPPVNPALVPLTDSSPPGKEPDTTPSLKPTVRLVDFAVHGRMEPAVAKVEVTIRSRVDTITGLLTSLNPTITTDGMIHGIAMAQDGQARDGYDYNSHTRKLTVFPLPSDLNGWFYEIELNDAATFVAYVAHVISGQTWAVVRSWPSLTVVARTSASEGYPSDVGYDQVRWLDSDHFRFRYRISSGPFVLVEGDAQRRTMKVDTLAALPN